MYALRETTSHSPGVGVEEVVLADPEDARELLVVARHQTGLGGLLADLCTNNKTFNKTKSTHQTMLTR